jgi:hypothetical protein
MVVLLRNLKLIAGVLFVSIIWFAGYKYGIYKIEYQEIQNDLTAKLNEKQKLIDKKTSAKVRTIYVQEDATGCIDTTIPDGVLEALHSDSIRPKPN